MYDATLFVDHTLQVLALGKWSSELYQVDLLLTGIGGDFKHLLIFKRPALDCLTGLDLAFYSAISRAQAPHRTEWGPFVSEDPSGGTFGVHTLSLMGVQQHQATKK